MNDAAPDLRHRPHEDALALAIGTLFVALGVVIYGRTGLLTGGTAGIAFLIHYATGWNFGLVFFVINLPFYGLAYKRMGRAFTLKTFLSIGLLTTISNLLPHWLELGAINPVFASVTGGLLMGTGMLILFRHQASLGGFNVLALYLQERFGWRAGFIQMGLDCAIVVLAFALTDWWHIALSVLGAIMMNQTLALNHRKGRYVTI
jgi:uncharacterized membrane-anchored protein YitT (DUF2179 family)